MMVLPNNNLPQFGKGTKLGGIDEYYPFEFSREYNELLRALVDTDLRPWSDKEKNEFWRKETDRLIRKEKLGPTELKKGLGLVTEISPRDNEEISLSRRAFYIKKLRGGLNPQGLAETPVAKKDCLKLYGDAFEYFIRRLDAVSKIRGVRIKVVPRGIAGSFAEGNARLGIHPLGIVYVEAKNENFALKRREERGVEFPSDIDFKIAFETSQGKIGSSSLIDERMDELAEEVFTEYGVFIQVDRYDIRNAVPMEEIEKSGGLFEFYLKKQKERGE
jgi:hypothetical protein